MAGGLGELRGTTKLDGDHVWNGSGTIEGLEVYLESQIDDRQTSFDPKNVQTWKMTRDKEDDDVWGLKDDKHSLEFIFDQSVRIEKFP